MVAVVVVVVVVIVRVRPKFVEKSVKSSRICVKDRMGRWINDYLLSCHGQWSEGE